MDSARQAQAQSGPECQANEKTERLADQRCERETPDAGFERAERYTGIHEAEEEQRHLGRMSGPELQPVERVGGASRRVHEEAWIARGVRQERDDRQQRQRRMESAEEERSP